MRLTACLFLTGLFCVTLLSLAVNATASAPFTGPSNVINKKVSCLNFERTEWMNEHLAYVVQGNNKGFVDAHCKPTIPIQPYYLKKFSEGFAVIGSDKFGYINEQGKIVIPMQYNQAASFSEGLALVRVDDKEGHSQYSYIDKAGNPVMILPKDISARSFSEGLAVVVNDQQKFGFIDHSGRLVIPYTYDYAANFYAGLALVSQYSSESKQKQFFIDKNGDKVLDVSQYDMVGRFHNGLVAVSKEQRCGFINQSGNLIIPIKHECIINHQSFASMIDTDRQFDPFISLDDMIYENGVIKKHPPYPEFFEE